MNRAVLRHVLPGLVALSLAACSARAATPQIEVEALFTDAAVLTIDGQRKMLRVGQSFGAVTLVEAHSRLATLEVDGATVELGISRRVGTHYQPPGGRVVEIPRDAKLQYQTTASINGRRVQVLVDELPMLTGDVNDVKWDALPIEVIDQVEVIKGLLLPSMVPQHSTV